MCRYSEVNSQRNETERAKKQTRNQLNEDVRNFSRFGAKQHNVEEIKTKYVTAYYYAKDHVLIKNSSNDRLHISYRRLSALFFSFFFAVL